MSNDILAVFAPYYTIPAGAIMRGKSGKDLKIEVSSDNVPPHEGKIGGNKTRWYRCFSESRGNDQNFCEAQKRGQAGEKAEA